MKTKKKVRNVEIQIEDIIRDLNEKTFHFCSGDIDNIVIDFIQFALRDFNPSRVFNAENYVEEHNRKIELITHNLLALGPDSSFVARYFKEASDKILAIFEDAEIVV